MRVYSASKQGKRNYQEDRTLVSEEKGIFVVADGMGGHPNGDLAAQAVCDQFLLIEETLPKNMVAAIKEADRLCMEARDSRGSTVVAVAISGMRATTTHVGDSRIYHLSDGKLVQLTKDHQTGGGYLTNCVGFLEQIDIGTVELKSGDQLLLCSDGIEDGLDHTKIREILLDPNIHDPAETLCERAILSWSRDNCSAIVIKA